MKYTINDIARLSGFSKKTVSRVLNNEPKVKPSTREAIQKVIKETNYRPNIYARNLNKQYTKNILISIRKGKYQNTTIWLEMILFELINILDASKYNIINEVIYDDEQTIIGTDVTLSFAIIFYAADMDERIELAKSNNLKHLIFGKSSQGPYVSNNERKAVIEGTEYLFSRGLKKISVLLGDRYENNVDRAKGIKFAYGKNDVALENLDIVFEMTSLEKVYAFVDEKIKKGDIPDAFFVSGDEKAIAVYHAIYDNGLKIPGDISVLGFDDIPLASHYYPPLTTIAQDFKGLAAAFNRIINNYFDDETSLESVEIDTKLIARKSTR